MRQKLIELQREIDEFTITFGDITTSLSEIHRSSRQKINKDIVELHSTFNQLGIIDTTDYLVIQQQIACSAQAYM